MSKHKVLLLGATGETGSDVLNGLLEDGSYDVTLLVQPSSADKPAVKDLSSKGLKIVIGDLNWDVNKLAEVVKGYDTVISTIAAFQQLPQLALIDACALAGTPRFVPCAFMTVCPPGGIMHLRDQKEIVYQRIWNHHLPYTIIDVGYWYQISTPRLPSGKIDGKLLITRNEVYGDGNTKSIFVNKGDIGRWVARIIKDDRTLNHKVIAYSEVLSQNEVIGIVERMSGETVDVKNLSKEELSDRLEKVRTEATESPSDFLKLVARSADEYSNSMHLRGDNTLEMAKYLGYLDATELYPDIKPVKFEEYFTGLLEGKERIPYRERYAEVFSKASKQ